MIRIDRLIVVAGVSCAGKTFLFDRLRRGELSELYEQLGMCHCTSWEYVNVSEWSQVQGDVHEGLVVHYDMYAQYSVESGFKHLNDLFDASCHVTVLTLVLHPDILCRRALKRLVKTFLLRPIKPLIPRSRRRSYSCLRRKLREYSGGKAVPELYKRWFRYIDESMVAVKWTLNSDDKNIRIAKPWSSSRDDN